MVEQPADDVALDKPLLPSGGLAQGGGREPVEVTHCPGGGLVEERSTVGGEELTVAAGAAEVAADGRLCRPAGSLFRPPPNGCTVGQTGAMAEAAARVFASHYQLMICDDPRRSVPEDANWSDRSFRCGFAGDLRTRLVGTEADLNDHWVEVTTSATPPDASQWQRITLVHFHSDTGKIHVMSVVDDMPRISMEVGVGDFSVYVAAKNIGIDLLTLKEDGELTDEQLAVRKDLEWYRIFVVPGRPREEGRIKDA